VEIIVSSGAMHPCLRNHALQPIDSRSSLRFTGMTFEKMALPTQEDKIFKFNFRLFNKF
jgi:hypothetical protein